MSYSYPYPSPLEGYEGSESLPTTFNADGQTLFSPHAVRSKAYDEFPKPILPDTNGFDFHVYYMQSDKAESKYARELHERIRREFLEIRIHSCWDRPMGPHPVATIQIDSSTPHETGVLFSCVLIHPNTGDDYKDHTELATWMGKPWPVNTEMILRQQRKREDGDASLGP